MDLERCNGTRVDPLHTATKISEPAGGLSKGVVDGPPKPRVYEGRYWRLGASMPFLNDQIESCEYVAHVG